MDREAQKRYIRAMSERAEKRLKRQRQEGVTPVSPDAPRLGAYAEDDPKAHRRHRDEPVESS